MPSGPREDETCREYVMPRLRDAGWGNPDHPFYEQFPVTDGRVIKVGNRHRRRTPLRADYMLEYRSGWPIAVVEAKRRYAIAGDGLQQAKRYAQLLDVPFVYSTNGRGIVEYDHTTGVETAHLTSFPTPDELWSRYQAWKGLSDGIEDGLLLPFNRDVRNSDGSVKEPRYYQRAAINRSVEAILTGRERLLLTMATGTGKTFVSLQIVWKLWQGGWIPERKPRVLYLADRNILIDQPIREYEPVFGGEGSSPIWQLRGEAKRGRELYFALYQAIADSGDDPNGIFREYEPDFFDLVIVDECHRGSARDDSAWRGILEHFSPATQLGMTATPKREETADTYAYFGNPLYEYSLAQGIDDGFLAPYRVRHVVLSSDAHGWSPDEGQLDLYGREIPPGLYETSHFERVVSLLGRTDAAARHLTNYLQSTDPWAKTVVFCVDQEHADEMRRALHNANRELTSRHDNYVVRITSDEREIGRGLFDDLADTEKELPVIATTSTLLSTGVDLPTVQNIVIFRPIGSMPLFKQIIGRGTRLFPDKDKLTFDIIDYVGATKLFRDPEFDGPPERVEDEEIDDEGNVVEDTVVEEPPPPPLDAGDDAGTPTENDEDDLIDPGDLDEEPRKYYVGETHVWVTAEAFYHLDPDTQMLRLVEYRDFVAETVRYLYPDPNELRSRWATRVGRLDVREALSDHGIDPDELIERSGLVDTDVFDALVHLAWNQPLATRMDRVRRIRQEHADFFASHQPAAREVLELLLEKYREHGVAQLDDLKVLQVPPLASLGTAAEIARRFGSSQALRDAVEQLSNRIYSA